MNEEQQDQTACAALMSVSQMARYHLRMHPDRYVQCVLSHALGFVAASDDPETTAGRLIDYMRASIETPEFRRACLKAVKGAESQR